MRCGSVERTVGLTSAVVSSLSIFCAVSGPCVRTEDAVFFNVVHIDGDTEHGAERDEVCAAVTVYGYAVVCTPVCHNAVNILECGV